MRIAILGSGTIVPDFFEAAEEIEELEVYAIFGREKSLATLQEYQEKYGIPHIYLDYGELLQDEQIDAVYVALPNHLHYSFAKTAIESHKNVIVEKPFASNYEQAEALIRLAEENHVVVFEAIPNQYMPNFEKTKELVKNVGDVKIIQMNYSQYSRRYDLFKEGTILPVFDAKKSGGALMDLNVYNIHYILGIFGKPQKIHYIANIEKNIDTSGILTMEYPSFQCVCIGAKDCKAPVSINIQGDKGYIHSDAPANVYGSFEFGLNQGEREEYHLNTKNARMYYELKKFVELVSSFDHEQLSRINEHALDVMKVLDEARRQVNI